LESSVAALSKSFSMDRCTITRRLAIFVVLLLPALASAQQSLTRYVDPFIGTGGHGHTFPGATMPFGMVQLSPDTRLSGWDGCSGYHYSDAIIYGFSHTHLSGTGISDYGDILFMPTAGEIYLTATNGEQTDKGYASRFSHRNEIAKPGFYAVKLDDENILVELTATNRVGLHRYTYPATDRANIVLDLTHRDQVLDSYLKIVDATHIEGFRRSSGWAKDQIVYFAAEFSKPFSFSGIAVDDKIVQGLREARGTNLKSFFRFDARSGRPILLKVAISAGSIEGAKRNLAAELDHWDFEKVKTDADRAWNHELSKVQVSGGTDAQLKTFYTALYHTMIAPNLFMDVDGQFRGRDLKVHHANGFTNYTVFSLWDTFRAAHPLYTIIDQKRTRDFIETFLAQYEYGGRLPVWELAGNETDTMIGYHAVPVIADAAVKNIIGFDREEAFAAMKHSAELKHFGLATYQAHGYIGMQDDRESVSKTLEYAYDDWCIAMMARMLGHEDDYERYSRRAQFYKNIFDTKTGFMRPKNNGGWVMPFDPREVSFNFTEANSWQYSFFVPQDISGLIELMGGKEKFARKLDGLFTADSRTTGREQADITGLIGQYAHGNEPSHHIAYLYDYAGEPWKTQFRVRQIMDKFYLPQPDGLIGNEDCGQMSAWYVLSAAGFYSVTPGSPLYAIGTPLFPELRFSLENGKSFVIKARGVSAQNIYIQSATLNGRPHRKSYLMHQDLMNGGELVFVMGGKPNRAWASGEGDVPVASIADRKIVPVPVINSAGQTFRDRIAVSIENPDGPARTYYTTDGSGPTLDSQLYVKPFSIGNTTTVKAVTVNESNEKSFIATAELRRLPHNWSIKTLSTYSSQYTGGGDTALIDGIRGTANLGAGAWQGYQGQDFAAIVDLGKVQPVEKLGAGFLQDVGSWIWLPTRVEIELSIDGVNFKQVLLIPSDARDNSYDVLVKDFVQTIPRQPARYVRVKAYNYGTIPAWHPGHGGQAWIFIDEIIIE
jgi:predicted alpha-1,2-mannosidase